MHEASVVLMIGDLTIHHKKWVLFSNADTTIGTELKTFCDFHGLFQIVREPTRQSCLLDSAFTDIPKPTATVHLLPITAQFWWSCRYRRCSRSHSRELYGIWRELSGQRLSTSWMFLIGLLYAKVLLRILSFIFWKYYGICWSSISHEKTLWVVRARTLDWTNDVEMHWCKKTVLKEQTALKLNDSDV